MARGVTKAGEESDFGINLRPNQGGCRTYDACANEQKVEIKPPLKWDFILLVNALVGYFSIFEQFFDGTQFAFVVTLPPNWGPEMPSNSLILTIALNGTSEYKHNQT